VLSISCCAVKIIIILESSVADPNRRASGDLHQPLLLDLHDLPVEISLDGLHLLHVAHERACRGRALVKSNFVQLLRLFRKTSFFRGIPFRSEYLEMGSSATLEIPRKEHFFLFFYFTSFLIFLRENKDVPVQ